MFKLKRCNDVSRHHGQNKPHHHHQQQKPKDDLDNNNNGSDDSCRSTSLPWLVFGYWFALVCPWTSSFLSRSSSSRQQNHSQQQFHISSCTEAMEQNKMCRIPTSRSPPTPNLHSKLSPSPINQLLTIVIPLTLLAIIPTLLLITMVDADPSPNPGPNPASKLSLQEWEEIFQSRSADNWRDLWHNEKHRRCHHQLMSHMAMVCDKDIYKMARRRRRRRKRSSGDDDGDNNRAQSPETENELNMLNNQRNQMSPSGEEGFNFHKNEYIFEPGPNHPLFISVKDANKFGLRHILKRVGPSVPPAGTEPIKPPPAEVYKRGITDECCDGVDGCSWEEYAEYCPANVRIRS